MKHKHVVTKIDVVHKLDCVFIECYCGKSEGIILYNLGPPKGWDKTNWNVLFNAAQNMYNNWCRHMSKINKQGNNKK